MGVVRMPPPHTHTHTFVSVQHGLASAVQSTHVALCVLEHITHFAP